MKQERVILSFIMVLIGLLVAGAIFYFYQSTKHVSPSTTNIITKISPIPTPEPKIYLALSQPVDEAVVSNKTLKISGKTNPEAIVVIITDSDQEVIQPSRQGDFSTTLTLANDQNIIIVRSILPSGETVAAQRTVTYSTLDF
jgi:hypothetical protein